jgi:hypothetical protein
MEVLPKARRGRRDVWLWLRSSLGKALTDIKARLEQLRRVAEMNRHDVLAYIIEMAEEEASNRQGKDGGDGRLGRA